MNDQEIRDILSQIRDEIRYGNSRDGSDLTPESINKQIEASITEAIKQFRDKLIEAERERMVRAGKSEKQIQAHLNSKKFRKSVADQAENERPRIEQEITAKVKGNARSKAWENLGGSKGRQIKDFSKDISRFGNSISVLAGNKGAVSKAGASITKFGGALSKIAPAVGIAVQVFEFAISKAAEYTKLHGENLMKEMNAVNAVNVKNMKANLTSWQDAVESAYSSQEAALANQQAIIEAQNAIELANLKMAHSWTNWIPILGELNKATETEMEMEQQVTQTRLKNAAEVISQVNEYTKRTDEYIKKQDDAIHQYQRINALTEGQTAIFEKRMFAQGEALAKFNRTIEDVLKMQNSVQENSGRAVNYSNNDYLQSAAVGNLVGDDNLTAFQSQMVLFNHSIAGSADIMYDMYRDANKMGLSSQKLTKSVLTNLKLAEKYSFKKGTQGLIEMAKWAENVRFNMGALGNMIEKGQSGGLEGAITQAAKLQVLGGNFAMGADPMAMQWELWNDPQAYAERSKGMLKGLGTVDKTTGETFFNMADRQRIRAYADAMGMSTEDAMNMVREDNKKTVVKKQMGASTLSEKLKDTVANKAQRDEKTGEWYVNTISGGRMNVNDVTESDIDNILSNNNEEQAIQYAKSTMSFTEQTAAAAKSIDAKLGNLTFDNYADTVKSSIETTLTAFSTSAKEIVSAIAPNRKEALTEQSVILDKLKSINTQLSVAYSEVKSFKKKAQEDFERMQKEVETKRENRKAAEAKNKQKMDKC